MEEAEDDTCALLRIDSSDGRRREEGPEREKRTNENKIRNTHPQADCFRLDWIGPLRTHNHSLRGDGQSDLIDVNIRFLPGVLQQFTATPPGDVDLLPDALVVGELTPCVGHHPTRDERTMIKELENQPGHVTRQQHCVGREVNDRRCVDYFFGISTYEISSIPFNGSYWP